MLELNSELIISAPGLVQADPPRNLHTQNLSRFSSGSSYEAALILMLCGFVDCSSAAGKMVFRQRQDFTVFGSTLKRRRIDSVALVRSLGVADIELVTLDQYLRKSLKQQAFYQEITLESAYFFAATDKGNHTIAFIHLYRFLERIAYVFPLMYASESDDFRGTYESFRAFISGEKGGELKFFHNFQRHCIEDGILEAPCTIDVEGLPNERFAYQALIKHVPAENVLFAHADTGLEMQAGGLTSLLVNLRNRFFHAASGHPGNISLLDVPVPDLFFGRLNPHISGWLFLIYFQILAKRVDRFS